jgi:regulator of replication initiation timing
MKSTVHVLLEKRDNFLADLLDAKDILLEAQYGVHESKDLISLRDTMWAICNHKFSSTRSAELRCLHCNKAMRRNTGRKM